MIDSDSAAFSTTALAVLLDWYVESGVDLALDDATHDRFAESVAVAAAPIALRGASSPPVTRREAAAPTFSPTLPPRPASGAGAVLAHPDEAIRAARETAAGAQDLDDLRARFQAFEHAPFKASARHFLFCAGAPGARLMVIDYAPGDEEERSGEAFAGARARLLDNMLAAIGLNRENAYLTYFSPWRPPGDKTATPHEAAILTPFVRRHVELARPDILLLFGDPPVRALLETGETAARLRGKWIDCARGEASMRAMPFISLAATLNSAPFKRAAWRALREVAEALGPSRGGGSP
jgi:DNA polymerase